ncbi:MAG: hypothetical protein K5910_05075 [Bacteroidales bacterium]|nr:hypothetical protein [Bacteroidales bacterium]
MTIIRKSTFPAGTEEIWTRLQSLDSLQRVAAPFATFKPLGDRQDIQWKEGCSFALHLRIFGMIPLGIHTIRIVSLDQEILEIRSEESNPHVPVWNHLITLGHIDGRNTEYTDKVDIEAGWKTPLIYLWARSFYAHRQRKWIRILKKEASA